MQHGQSERYLYKWVSASHLNPWPAICPLCTVARVKRVSFRPVLPPLLHPQGLKCSRTFPWCCTSWWRSLTGRIPRRRYWRTQVPLGGGAEPVSQVTAHREVLRNTQVHSARDPPHAPPHSGAPPLFSLYPKAVGLTGLAGFTKSMQHISAEQCANMGKPRCGILDAWIERAV